jgi:lipopolysaccharide export system protein LptA
MSSTAFARKDDIKQPLSIDAGSATFNRAKGYAVYQGNVSIKQGTLKISAAKIEIFAPNNDIVRIEASGSPVKFQQEMDDGKMAIGQANTVRYLVKEKKLLLAGNAKLTQGSDSTFSSGSISYSVNTGELKASSGSGKKSTGRVKAVFYPTNK